MSTIPTMSQRLAAALRLALGVPSRAEHRALQRQLQEVQGLLTAMCMEREADPNKLNQWEEVQRHLDTLCRAWLAAGQPLHQEGADEVLRRGRAGREALDEALRAAGGRR